jgi:CheY-like chemotaxis protein
LTPKNKNICKEFLFKALALYPILSQLLHYTNPAEIMKKKTSIYIVDDDDDDLMLMKEAFENIEIDIQITELSNGKDLLDLINLQTARSMPDLILADVNMPKMNGLDALSILKSIPAAQQIPVIILSTSNDPSLIKQAYDYGTCAFITKPTSILAYNQIAESVSQCFLNNHALKEKHSTCTDFARKSILIIEDNDDQWALVSLALNKSMPAIDLLRISTRSSTLDFLTNTWNTLQSPPDLIILDLYLPTRRDGLNLLDSIHYFFKIHRLAPVPVIIFSSSHDEEDINVSYQHSASAFMSKATDIPYSIPYLQNFCTFWWQTISLPKKRMIFS